MPPVLPNVSIALRTKQQHTTHEHPAEVVIWYPFHPRCGERLTVIRFHRWHGEVAYIVRDGSGILTYVPTWMSEPSAAQFTIQSEPRLSVPALLGLRRLLDAVLSSFVAHEGGSNEERGGAAATAFPNRRRSSKQSTVNTSANSLGTNRAVGAVDEVGSRCNRKRGER